MNVLATSPTGVDSTMLDVALSDEGSELRKSLVESQTPPRPRADELFNRISLALRRGLESEGLLVSVETFGHMVDLLVNLRDEFPLPDIVVESESEVGLDWDRGARRVLTVTVRKTNLGWAALLGREPAYGTAPVSNRVPEIVCHLLRRIYSKSNDA